MLYDQIASKVGEYLKAEPSHIRFSTMTASTGKPRTPVKRTINQTLQSIMSPQFSGYNSTGTSLSTDSLFYEVLELSLSELERKKTVKIYMLSDGITKEVQPLMYAQCL